ncbi:MAG: hypothetical protein COA38_16405 [Fluviicola sp.]|nr:MAG: hypothetical protein COA38_16405 [Fluviicola sp.]
MIRNLFFFLSCTVILGACSISEKPEDKDKPLSNEVKTGNQICINHSYLILDSTTYYAAVNSEFIKQFAFSQERQLNGYKGFYLYGKTNYLELFHPKSFDGYEEEEGGAWICLASLKPNYINNLNKKKLDCVEYKSDEHYHDLSLIVDDSVELITTWEMTKKHYESWTKKEYHDSMAFLPVDYNSPQDSDSSSNYIFSDLNGIGLSLKPEDSLALISYLTVVGFDVVSELNGHTRLSNNGQFIELLVSKEMKAPTINRLYIKLNQPVERSTEVIGNSRIEFDGKSAVWIFE